MIYPMDEISGSDIDVIRKQLGSEEAHIAGIVERCSYGYPSVVLLSPVKDPGNSRGDLRSNKKIYYTAAANLLWLTCPYLNRKIHDLESDGYIRKIEELIQDDSLLEKLMYSAHAHYYFFRKEILNYFLGNITSIHDSMIFVTTGIGGIRDIRNIKCLHLHYAHYRICRNNVAGRLAYELLDGAIQCEEVLCSNAPIKK